MSQLHDGLKTPYPLQSKKGKLPGVSSPSCKKKPSSKAWSWTSHHLIASLHLICPGHHPGHWTWLLWHPSNAAKLQLPRIINEDVD